MLLRRDVFPHPGPQAVFNAQSAAFRSPLMVGTIFEKSPTPLTLWFHAILLFSNAKSGLSAKMMERELNVTYKCAYRILGQIRKALKARGDLLGGIVESDAAYFGGRYRSGKDAEHQKEAIAAKTMAIAAIQRGGEMRVRVIASNNSKSTEKFLSEVVEPGSALFTDKSGNYHSSQKKFERFSVNHKRKQFSDGIVHINRVEAFWHHVKGSIRGTFKSVSKQHLQEYLDAFAFHYNNRHNDRKRFSVCSEAYCSPKGREEGSRDS